jgi:hypothetical protein
MLNVITLNAITVSYIIQGAIMPSVILPSVLAPREHIVSLKDTIDTLKTTKEPYLGCIAH